MVDSIEGVYSLYLLEDPRFGPVTQMAIIARGEKDFSIRGLDQAWSGEGRIEGKQGYYDWTFDDGRAGRTVFAMNLDETLNGYVLGSGVEWWYLARRSERNRDRSGSERMKWPPVSRLTSEAEWLDCPVPTLMLDYLCNRASERKLRLFACACCWRIWPPGCDDSSRPVLELFERYADGDSSLEELTRARRVAEAAMEGYTWEDCRRLVSEKLPMKEWIERARVRRGVRAAGHPSAQEAASAAAPTTSMTVGEGGPRGFYDPEDQQAQAALLRDLFGNPFRPAAIDQARLAWNDGTVRKIAQAIYDDRSFDLIPILADALEEAGCTDPDILAHCRDSGQHVRGCWAVDLVLGKT